MLNNNRILICGADGYIGTALYDNLISKKYNVLGIDNGMRDIKVISIGGGSLTDPSYPSDYRFDIAEGYISLERIVSDFRPGTIINLAQQPSAPFSMKSPRNTLISQLNNIGTNLNVLWAVKSIDPSIHIIQIGTAGEFPDWLYPHGIDIPEESRVTVQVNGKDWTIPTPRYGGSFYHLSKSYSSLNSDYACRVWGLRITDINQGIVYGHVGNTRFDYDEYFGTVLNRFVVQAVAGIPLTIYGNSGGQTRSFIHLSNSIDAIRLLLENPAESGKFRTVQQLTEVYTVKEIADMVQELTGCDVQYIKNPRAEMDENIFDYNPKILKTLGLKTIYMKDELPNLINVVEKNKDNIIKDVIMPKHSWK